ncbi:MAG: CinA family protein [Dinoroseobacter sp.]|nr:CinA family protein [Dinoroseobacter sp.]
MTLAETLLDICTARSLQVTTAESCTGGMVAAAITDVAGSSNIFERGIVTYSNGSKVELLGVSADTIRAHGAVSEPVAREMADGALRRSGANIAVSITGIAGPGGSEFKPEGRVCFGIATNETKTQTETIEYGPLGRAQVRAYARDHALKRLIAAAQRR